MSKEPNIKTELLLNGTPTNPSYDGSIEKILSIVPFGSKEEDIRIYTDVLYFKLRNIIIKHITLDMSEPKHVSMVDYILPRYLIRDFVRHINNYMRSSPVQIRAIESLRDTIYENFMMTVCADGDLLTELDKLLSCLK